MNDLATWYFNGFDWLCIFSSHFELLSGIPQTLAILQAQSDVSWLETWNKELPGLLGGLQHMGKNNGQCYLFIYSFVHLFIYSFIHLFIYSFICLFIFVYLFTYLFNCLYCLNRELAILGCWTAIARDPESILLCSYDHLLVITGYFNGIIHFINGILLVLITGISGHNSGSSWISDFQAIASHGESGRSPRPGSGSPISHARNTASFQQGLAIRWDPSQGDAPQIAAQSARLNLL